MKILFLTRKFAPQNYIGAIRPTKFAKYLVKKYNKKVDVICKEDTSEVIDTLVAEDIKGLSHLEIIPYCRWTTHIQMKYSEWASGIKLKNLRNNESSLSRGDGNIIVGWIKGTLKSAVRSFLYLVALYDSYLYGRRAIKRIKKIIPTDGYNAYFSTTSLIESYIVGKWLKNKYPDIVWVYDLRDPIRIYSYPMPARRIMKCILKKTVNLVDDVTGVSTSCVDEFKEAGHKAISILPNGFDYDDLKGQSEPEDRINDGKFKIVYTGTLYDGKRDVVPLLLLLLELTNESQIDLSKIEIHYAGKDAAIIKSNIASTGMNVKLIDHGFITRAESIRLQQSADVLLLMSWNSIGETGVVTGKFYEYLMIGRPICCFVKGNLANSTLRDLLEDSEAGVCYEEADASTHERMKEFITERYRVALGMLKPKDMKETKIQRFNYVKLTEQLNNLLCKN